MQATVLKQWAAKVGLKIIQPSAVNLFGLGFWTPHAGAQSEFLASDAREVFFGGAAGGGKSDCLLIGALEQIHHARYNGIIFRRTFADLNKADGPVERSKLYYPHLGGIYNGMHNRWTFPSGAKIYFGGLERDDDKLKYQSAQFQYIAFDELTHFLETQYLYLFSRNRLPYEGAALSLKIRAASNPGGLGHEWVKTRFVTVDIINQARHFARIDDKDTEVSADHHDAMSRLFIPAKHTDNPSLDTNYVKSLRQLDPVTQAQLIEGDWDAFNTDELVYANWSNEHNISSAADYNPDLEVHWSIDDGYNPNPRAVLLLQVWPDDTVRVFDEYYETGQLHDETIDYLLSLPYARPTMATCDPSANLLIATLSGSKYGIYTIAGYNKLADGIKGVRNEICDGLGVRRLLVHPRCKNLIREITIYRNDPKLKLPNGDPRPVKAHDHLLDSLRYYCATHRMWRNQ